MTCTSPSRASVSSTVRPGSYRIRTPLGSSNSIARSLRHNSPGWLPSGVTRTTPADCPFTTAPATTRHPPATNAARTNRLRRMEPPNLPDPPDVPDPRDLPDPPDLPASQPSQQRPRGVGLLGARIPPLDAKARLARQLAVPRGVGSVMHVNVPPVQIAIIDRKIQPYFRVALECRIARQEPLLRVGRRRERCDIGRRHRLIE